MFFSSRTFPGHEYSVSTASAAPVSSGHAVLWALARALQVVLQQHRNIIAVLSEREHSNR